MKISSCLHLVMRSTTLSMKEAVSLLCRYDNTILQISWALLVLDGGGLRRGERLWDISCCAIFCPGFQLLLQNGVDNLFIIPAIPVWISQILYSISDRPRWKQRYLAQQRDGFIWSRNGQQQNTWRKEELDVSCTWDNLASFFLALES